MKENTARDFEKSSFGQNESYKPGPIKNSSRSITKTAADDAWLSAGVYTNGIPKDKVEERLKTMLSEVGKQVEDLYTLFQNPEKENLTQAIINRDDYIDVLKSEVNDWSFKKVQNTKTSDDQARAWFQAAIIIGSNLEKIGDFAVTIAGQINALNEKCLLSEYKYHIFFDHIFSSIKIFKTSLFIKDFSQAFRICQNEVQTDRLYKETLEQIINQLNNGGPTVDCVMLLFIFQNLERMADALLNVGEAIVSIGLGEKLKCRQYHQLQASLESAGMEGTFSDLKFEPIFGNRSGSRIGTVKSRNGHKPSDKVLFKQGLSKKIQEEKRGNEEWEKLVPGLSPKVLAYHQDGNNASLITEYFPGRTLEDLALNHDRSMVDEALQQFQNTMETVWSKTLIQTPVTGSFMSQLTSRLSDVYSIYPELDQSPGLILTSDASSISELISRAREIERELEAPFSVWIHGDCNLNNILYDDLEYKVRFLDLHRSRRADYLQDTSVFIISALRLTSDSQAVKRRLLGISTDFYEFARDFAQVRNDTAFEARLALGLARSFITSTRFVTGSIFAWNMYQHGVYLLDAVVSHSGQPWGDFRLNREIFEL